MGRDGNTVKVGALQIHASPQTAGPRSPSLWLPGSLADQTQTQTQTQTNWQVPTLFCPSCMPASQPALEHKTKMSPRHSDAHRAYGQCGHNAWHFWMGEDKGMITLDGFAISVFCMCQVPCQFPTLTPRGRFTHGHSIYRQCLAYNATQDGHPKDSKATNTGAVLGATSSPSLD